MVADGNVTFAVEHPFTDGDQSDSLLCFYSTAETEQGVDLENARLVEGLSNAVLRSKYDAAIEDEVKKSIQLGAVADATSLMLSVGFTAGLWIGLPEIMAIAAGIDAAQHMAPLILGPNPKEAQPKNVKQLMLEAPILTLRIYPGLVLGMGARFSPHSRAEQLKELIGKGILADHPNGSAGRDTTYHLTQKEFHKILISIHSNKKNINNTFSCPTSASKDKNNDL